MRNTQTSGRAAMLSLFVLALAPLSSSRAVIEFDQDATPTIIFGSGNTNGAFTTERANGVELALRGKLRYDESGSPANQFRRSGSEDSYVFYTRSRPDFPSGQRGEWSFEWSVNVDFDDSSGNVLADLTYELGLDADPGAGTDFLTFDPITPTAEVPFFDHAIGDNTTTNGDGTVATDAGSYATLLANNNVAQNSWMYGFFLEGALTDYDPRVPGVYDIYLEARDSEGTLVARTEIEVIVVDPPLQFSQNITPDVIFGSGNANGAFTTDRRNDMEIGIRGKLRFDQNGAPQPIYNDNGDGTYSFNPGVAPGQGSQTAEWAFDWTVNVNYLDTLTGEDLPPQPTLGDYIYEMGLDGDPSQGTDFLVFDPIIGDCFDHSTGDNSTTDADDERVACDRPPTQQQIDDYQQLLASNNVAQNSWRYDFFLAGPLADFDPTVDGNYQIYILARNADGVVVARDDIQILVGGASAGNVADLALTMSTSAAGTQLSGDTVNYSIVVTNNDLATATNVVVSDTLPDNLSFVAGSCDDGTMATVSGQDVSFALMDLPSGATTTCSLETQVSAAGVIVNTASVTADNGNDATDNSDSVRLLGVIQSVAASGDTPTAMDNDYTRINDVIQAAGEGDTIILEGTFDWNEGNAFSSWALGSDGVADSGDEFNILVPDGLANVTVTAAAPGDATIQGPGDLASQQLEGFLQFFGNNPGWEISNLVINDFDVALGIYYNRNGPVTGVNVYDDTRIVDNHIRMARDIAGSSDAGEAFQNIGIHYAFGDNQLIARNVIEIPGDAQSSASLRAASVGMQSNTSGGAYEGLVIEDNEIRILNAQMDQPEGIIGIWENGGAHTSNVTVRNNRFLNLDPGNDPALNNQEGFRIHSHSSATSTVRYEGNYVEGAAEGYAWLSFESYGSNFSDHEPVEFIANTAVNNGVAIVIDSNGAGNFRCNRIVGNELGIDNITQTGRVSIADDNWWGCNAGPGTGACDSVATNVTTDSWLVAALSADPDVVDLGGTSDVSLDVTGNSDGMTVSDCAVPETPVAFSAEDGGITPEDTTTVNGIAPAVYTAPNFVSFDTVTATIDGETLQISIDPENPVIEELVFADSFEGN